MARQRIRIAYGTVIDPDLGRRHPAGDELVVDTARTFWRRRLADGSAVLVMPKPENIVTETAKE